MAVFAFYSFEIKHLARQVELDFPDLEEKPKHEEQEELVHDVFAGDSVDLWTAFRRANGSYDKRSMERYKNEILAHRDGVIAMTIEANKHKTTIEDKHKVTHPHNPFCFVIIDYRKGQNLMAGGIHHKQPELIVRLQHIEHLQSRHICQIHLCHAPC